VGQCPETPELRGPSRLENLSLILKFIPHDYMYAVDTFLYVFIPSKVLLGLVVPDLYKVHHNFPKHFIPTIYKNYWTIFNNSVHVFHYDTDLLLSQSPLS